MEKLGYFSHESRKNFSARKNIKKIFFITGFYHRFKVSSLQRPLKTCYMIFFSFLLLSLNVECQGKIREIPTLRHLILFSKFNESYRAR